MPTRHVIAAVVHLAFSTDTTKEEIDAIIEKIKGEHKSIIGAGYHGLKDFNSDYPTQV